MKTIAILNEKGGTAKTTTSVNLAASLGEMGKKVLLVDLDGQAASSRWLGVEGDSRLADALLQGGGLVPIDNVMPGVSLAPASGKLDSISHNLRPTQGSQLRRVLAEMKDRYDYILIDCPPSLGNRLIGNALLAASHAIVPVETSILALDGLRILLTMLDDIRQGFEHDIELIGALGCRFNSRTRLSRLVLAELHRALPGKVFGTVIHETVRMQECPASGKSILEYAPNCSAAEDYQAVARELVYGITPCTIEIGLADITDITENDDLDQPDCQRVSEFRKRAADLFCRPDHKTNTVDEPVGPEDAPVTEEPRDVPNEPETQDEPHIPVRSVNITLTPRPPKHDETEAVDESPEQIVATTADEDAAEAPAVRQEPVEPVAFDEDEQDQTIDIAPETHALASYRHNIIVGIAATVLLGILGIGGWVGFKALTPSPETASARSSPLTPVIDRDSTPPKAQTTVVESTAVNADNIEEYSGIYRRETAVQPKTEADQAVGISTPEKATVVLPKRAADRPDDVRQAKQAPEVVGKSQPTLKPKDGPPKETTLAALSKPLGSIVAKGKPASKAPTTQPGSNAPTTQPASTTSASGKTSPQPPRSARAEDYPTALTLTGVMYGKTSRRAIISGNVVYEGDKVKGVKIVKILPDSVEIEANGFRFLLGTGPKPIWLKATPVSPPKDKKVDSVPTDTDSHE